MTEDPSSVSYSVNPDNKLGYTIMCESNERDDSVFGFNLFRFEINGDNIDRWEPPYVAGETNTNGRQLGVPDLSVCGEPKIIDVTRYSEEGLCGSLKIELTVTDCPSPKECQGKQGKCSTDDDCCSNLMCRRNRRANRPGKCIPKPNPRTCVRTNGECGPGKNRCCFGNVCKKQNGSGKQVCLPKAADRCVRENDLCYKNQVGIECCGRLSCEEVSNGENRCLAVPN